MSRYKLDGQGCDDVARKTIQKFTIGYSFPDKVTFSAKSTNRVVSCCSE